MGILFRCVILGVALLPAVDAAQKERAKDVGEITGRVANATGQYLEKFFLDQLKDIYYAEQKIVQSLPKMIEATKAALIAKGAPVERIQHDPLAS